MGARFAVDFGTTNTATAYWNEDRNEAEILNLPDLSLDGKLPLVPSLVYAGQEEVIIGARVRALNLDQRPDRRLFRNFKRSIITPGTEVIRPSEGKPWTDRDAARYFLTRLLAALPMPLSQIETLVLTAPVGALDQYLVWLSKTLDVGTTDKIFVVDESTAAALGYAVRVPGALVLVVDFGGGTLDLSLVQLPQDRQRTGGGLNLIRRVRGGEYSAKVIAKTGRALGGSDVDRWLLVEVCQRLGLTVESLGDDESPLLTHCETAKIALSSQESVVIEAVIGSKSYSIPFSQTDLRRLLEVNGFFGSLRQTLDRLMHVAHREGIYKEDIEHVALVGGTTLIPSVRRALQSYFENAAQYTEKPFTAVVEGSLMAASGMGLEDYLVNSYGLRHLDPETGAHAYDEIIPQGTRYPSTHPIEVLLGPSHPDQESVEFVIGMLNPEATSALEVRYEDGKPVFVARPDMQSVQVIALNAGAPPLTAPLDPPGQPGKDRIRAEFRVDAERALWVTAIDLQTGKTILENCPLVTLR